MARTSGGASASPPAFSLDGGDDFGVMSGLDAALAASTMPSLPLTRANATILGGGTSGGVIVDTTAGAMATVGLPAAAAAAAASPTAVRCPACNVRLPDFDDMQLHLLTDCAARGTDAHRATMTNLFGWVETPSSGGVDGAPTPPGAPVSRSASPMVTEVEGPRPPPAASTMVDVAVTDAQERVSPRSATDAAVVPAHSAPTQPPAMQADTARGKWKCPQCDALFDVEDDAQVHVMTECPTPWDDAAAALRAISRVGGRRATMDADHYDAHVAFTHGYDDEHDDSDMDGDESISSASHASSPLPMSLGAFAALASLEHSTSETSSTVDAVTAPGIAVTDDGTAWRRAMEVELKCPSCSYIGTTSEGLQMHMLTECMDVDRNMTLLFDAASPPSGA
ncbi:hypothetical protein EON62_03070 [archaeon]|nr:MAG: hypothetical protein EON62_03070 [archaeon]